MVALWGAAVGYVWLPIWHGADLRLAAPGLLVALALVLLTPFLIPVFGIALGATSIVMGPAVGLVSSVRDANLWRGLLCISIAGVSLDIPRFDDHPALTVQVLLELLLLPLGIVLVGAAASGGRRRFAPWAASVLFMLDWVVWMLRDHYYRLSR